VSAKENKKIVERFVDRVVIGRDLDAVDTACREDAVLRVPNGVAYGHSGLKKQLAKALAAIPDCRFSQEYCLAEGDYVACRIMLRATFTGDYAELPANGRKVALPELWTFCLSEGRIVEIEVTYDMGLLQAQVGTLLPNVIEK
jgi:predicted ester cyclase